MQSKVFFPPHHHAGGGDDDDDDDHAAIIIVITISPLLLIIIIITTIVIIIWLCNCKMIRLSDCTAVQWRKALTESSLSKLNLQFWFEMGF